MFAAKIVLERHEFVTSKTSVLVSSFKMCFYVTSDKKTWHDIGNVIHI